jgi:hypothetical protein
MDSPDILPNVDFFLRPSQSNAQSVLQAIRKFGFGSVPITPEDLMTAGRVIQLGLEPNRIDLMTSISGVGFEEAWSTRVQGKIDGLAVAIIGREALLQIKGRPEEPRIASTSKNC